MIRMLPGLLLLLLGAALPAAGEDLPADPIRAYLESGATPDDSPAAPSLDPEPTLPDPSRIPRNPAAMWVVRDGLISQAAVRGMVQDAVAAGITDIFLQVRGRGDAYYPTNLAPIGPPLADAWRRNGEFDPLALALQLGREAGIRVHAWLNVYLVQSGSRIPSGHILLQHPEWAAVDGRGTPMTEMGERRFKAEWTEGVYLEPGNAEVLRHFVRIVEELIANYPLAGIHLDYVRYPEMNVGYSPEMRAGFERRAGIDPLELFANESGLRRERGNDGYEALLLEWNAFKADQVTALVKQVRTVMRRTRPEMLLSAAVKPTLSSGRRVGQDWISWINEDLIDIAAPMLYATERGVVREQAVKIARLVPPERVWGGIAVYNKSVGAAERDVLACRDAGLGGVSIFSYNSLPGGGKTLTRLSQAR